MTKDEAIWQRDLLEEVNTLKRQLKQITGEDSDKWHLLGLTQAEERVLRVLLIREYAPLESLHTALYWDKGAIGDNNCLQVFICRIKQKLPWIRPWIKNHTGRGYWMTKEGKHRLMYELRNPA